MYVVIYVIQYGIYFVIYFCSFISETPGEVADKPNLTWLDAAQVNISLKSCCCYFTYISCDQVTDFSDCLRLFLKRLGGPCTSRRSSNGSLIADWCSQSKEIILKLFKFSSAYFFTMACTNVKMNTVSLTISQCKVKP